MFLHAMTRNIKIHNILDIIQISKFVKLNKCIHEKKWQHLFKCFLWFFKVWWIQENQGVMFLVVPLKDEFTLKLMFKLPNKGGKAFKYHMLKWNNWSIRITWVDVHKILNQQLFAFSQIIGSIFRWSSQDALYNFITLNNTKIELVEKWYHFK
jgi:hypothetical protein